jgi:uncharacterized membrane protein YqjE
MSPETEPAALSSAELIKTVMQKVAELAKTEFELAKTELKADLKAESSAAKGLGVAAVAGLVALNLLMVTAVLALAQVMPAWGAGLLVSGVMLLIAVIAGVTGWGKRVKSPLARTRRDIKEDVQWTKEKIA